MALALDLDMVGQVVVIGVAVVFEAAFLDEKLAGVDRGAIAAIPAQRPLPGGFSVIEAIARRMWSASSSRLSFHTSSQRQPWEQASWPFFADPGAHVAIALRATALAKKVTGMSYVLNMRSSRQMPAREPYS